MTTSNWRARRRRASAAIAALALVVGAAACGDDDDGGEQAASGETTVTTGTTGAEAPADDFPDGPHKYIVAADVGGSTDQMARRIAPSIEEALGESLVIENAPGANTQVATTLVANAPDDCNTLLATGFPHFVFSYMSQEAPYDRSTFAPVGNVVSDVGVLIVRNDAPWQTLQELVDDAKSRPGEIRASVSTLTSPNYVALLQLEQATGAKFNTVPFDGGGPARNALVSGEVQVSHADVFNHQSVAADTRVLAVWSDENQWPELTDDAPTAAEALGTEFPETATRVGVLVHAGCRDNYPERYQILVDALAAAVESPAFLQVMEEGEAADQIAYLDPDGMDELLEATELELEELIATYPELQRQG